MPETGRRARGRVPIASTSATSAINLGSTRFCHFCGWLACAVAVVSTYLPSTSSHRSVSQGVSTQWPTRTALSESHSAEPEAVSRLSPDLQLISILPRGRRLGRLSGYCPARRCLSFRWSQITRLSLSIGHFSSFLDHRHLVHVRPPPSSIASLRVRGASTPLDYLCLPVWPVSASVSSDSCNPAPPTVAAPCQLVHIPRLVFFRRPSHYVTFHRVGRLLCCARRSLALLPRGPQGSRVESREPPTPSVHARYPSAPPLVTADCRYPPAAACHSARCMHLPPSPHLLSADQIRSIHTVRLAIWRV